MPRPIPRRRQDRSGPLFPGPARPRQGLIRRVLAAAAGLSLALGNLPAEIILARLVVDGEAQELEAGLNSPPRLARPWRIPASARSLEFHFTEGGRDGRPGARLRFQLEGHDEGWRDLPVQMRAIIRFRDRDNQIIGGNDFPVQGETWGWRGNLDDSEFIVRTEQATAPERAVSARIAFLSHGGDAGLGVMGIDGVHLRITTPGTTAPRDYDLGVTPGIDLEHPRGSPRLWGREGSSRADLARLGFRTLPEPHPILVLEDDDPGQYGVWTTRPETRLPVQPGDQLTLTWKTAHSLGKAGPGQALYPRLAPGRYSFRVAAARANGELTGQEVSVPIEVIAPWFQRWEVWLLLGTLGAGAAVAAAHLTARRRLQRRLAEVQREQTLERERARIARDLHDDIGAGLSEIAMQSDWVRRDLERGPTEDTRRRIARVCASAIELTRSVDEIVWAVTPANDTLPRFVSYLTQATEQFLDAAGLRVRFDLPSELPAVALPGRLRHILFLAVREALNNAAKHARAGLVRLEVLVHEGGLEIALEDDGIGFDPARTGAAGTHEGLGSMRRRMEEIGGSFRLTSRVGSGTRVEFRVPLRGGVQ